MGQNFPYVPNPLKGAKLGAEREKALAKAERTPMKAHNEKYLKLTYDRVSDGAWEEIVDKAIEQAKQGNPTARQWLSNYTIGIPRQMPEEQDEAKGNFVIINNFPRPELKAEIKAPEIIVEGEVTDAHNIQPS